LLPTERAVTAETPVAVTKEPLEVNAAQGMAAAARSYADFTAALDAMVVEEDVETLSEIFDWREEETTALLESVPV
jgi:hypothetical protein